MNTIYLNDSNFEAFITKKQYKITRNSFKEGKTKTYTLKLKHKASNLTTHIFISDIESITVPYTSMIPQFISLFGLPAGIFNYEYLQSNEPKLKTKNANAKDIKYTDIESRYLHYRRALLFANAWMIKASDATMVKNALNYILSEKVSKLLFTWIDQLVQFGRYLEDKPKKQSLDDELYDFQFIAMGKVLREYFFPELEKMEIKHSNWLIQKCNKANAKDAPERFVGFEPLIAGYLIALKASNSGKTNLDFVNEKAQNFEFESNEQHFTMIYSSMFFIGLFESRADNYFYTSSAFELFSIVEKISWQFANNEYIIFDLTDTFKSISLTDTKAKENAINYYKVKNPSIREKEVVQYSDKTPEINPEKVYMFAPSLSSSFLDKSGNITRLSVSFDNNVLITKEDDFFNDLKEHNIDAILLNEHEIKFSNSIFPKHANLITDSKSIKRWLRIYHNKNAEFLSLNKNFGAKNIILITENYSLSKFDKYMLSEGIDLNKTEQITIFNFFEMPQPNKKVRNEGQANLFNNMHNVPSNIMRDNTKLSKTSNAKLQKEIEELFAEKRCRVISKQNSDAPWEMVMLGIGVMKDFNFSDSLIIDLRQNEDNKAPYEIILRCFRDIIVYDKEQKYMFMNLS